MRALALLAVALTGCQQTTSVLHSPGCSDALAIDAPFDPGCVQAEIPGSDVGRCVVRGDDAGAPFGTGAWVVVRRDGPLRARLTVGPVGSSCSGAGDCPEVTYAPSLGDPCGCARPLGVATISGDAPVDVLADVPPGETELLLPGSSRRYQVTICTLGTTL